MQQMVAPAERARLTNFLIGKSVTEALFVGALAVSFYLTAFTPYFRGTLDYADAERVAGWVVNLGDAQSPVQVQLYIDGQFAGHQLANQSRPDVKAAGRAESEHHGFVFETPRLAIGQHEARVYAVHMSGEGQRRTLQLIGKPLVFNVVADDMKKEGTGSVPGGL